jgi:hypothetical protein
MKPNELKTLGMTKIIVQNKFVFFIKNDIKIVYPQNWFGPVAFI